MTTDCLAYPRSTRSTRSTAAGSHGSGFLKLVLLGIVIALALGVIATAHAEKHAEADAIRRCLDDRGPTLVMKNVHHPTFYLVCQIDKQKWGIQAVDESGYERTAFSPGDGSYSALMRYLNRIANRYGGKLPWH